MPLWFSGAPFLPSEALIWPSGHFGLLGLHFGLLGLYFGFLGLRFSFGVPFWPLGLPFGNPGALFLGILGREGGVRKAPGRDLPLAPERHTFLRRRREQKNFFEK